MIFIGISYDKSAIEYLHAEHTEEYWAMYTTHVAMMDKVLPGHGFRYKTKRVRLYESSTP